MDLDGHWVEKNVLLMDGYLLSNLAESLKKMMVLKKVPMTD